MKTPEQFLREVIKYFPDEYVLDTPDEGISIHSIIMAMEEYAKQSVDCASDNAVHQIETLRCQLVDVTLERDELDEQYKQSVNTFEITNISLNEQRSKYITFLSYILGYPVQLTPGLRAEIHNYIDALQKAHEKELTRRR
jgi:hypothetical protein